MQHGPGLHFSPAYIISTLSLSLPPLLLCDCPPPPSPASDSPGWSDWTLIQGVRPRLKSHKSPSRRARSFSADPAPPSCRSFASLRIINAVRRGGGGGMCACSTMRVCIMCMHTQQEVKAASSAQCVWGGGRGASREVWWSMRQSFIKPPPRPNFSFWVAITTMVRVWVVYGL